MKTNILVNTLKNWFWNLITISKDQKLKFDSDNVARQVITLIEEGKSVIDVKAITTSNDTDWYRASSKAYNIKLKEAKKERKQLLDPKRRGSTSVGATSNDEISGLLLLNERLAHFALSIPGYSTMSELEEVTELAKSLPESELRIIRIIGGITLSPRMRVLQKKGRFEKFDCFSVFSKIIDAALLSLYRTNYISCYLTLVPVIEGVILRWMGYKEGDEKPDFEEIRKFFKQSSSRQPCPTNIQFHQVFTKACDEILNNHYFKPSNRGKAHSNFNRHIASHLLNDNHFATRENCIRLFLLLDLMTDIYVYESRGNDPRFYVKGEEMNGDFSIYTGLLETDEEESPEKILLNATDG